MAQSDFWFPFYVGDYMADTMHLSTELHGAYFLLLCAYYKNRGPLEDSEDLLTQITKMTVTVWQKARSPLAKFFEIKDGYWHHRRADFELKRRELIQVARIQSAKRTNAKLGRTVTDTVTDTHSDTVTDTQLQLQSQLHKQSKSKIQPDCLYPTLAQVLTEADMRGYSKAQAESFWNHFEGSGWIDKNGNEIKKWRPKLANWIANSKNNPVNAVNGSKKLDPSYEHPLTKAAREARKPRA